MKKYLLISSLLCILVLFSVVNIVNASLVITEEETVAAINSLLTFNSTEFLKSIDTTQTISSIKGSINQLTNSEFYQIETTDYLLNLDSVSKEVIGLYSKQLDCDFTSTASKALARSFILSKYAELELPSEYELVYLEKLDDYVWEANFQKKYGDVYNMYESVKIFFIPETQTIAALTVFDEEYSSPSAETMTVTEATEIAETELDINNIVSSELTIIKENNYFNNENQNTNLHKAWVLTTADEEYIYVDSSTGEIIGGDCINE